VSGESHLRPRSFFEIVDGSVRHYRARFGAYLVPFLPVVALSIVSSLVTSAMQGFQFNVSAEELTPGMMFDFMNFWILMFVFSIIAMSAGALGFASTVYMAAGDLEGHTMKPGSAWRRAGGRFWPLIALILLASWIIGFASIFLLIPGIYLTIRFGVSPQVLLLERRNVGDAFGRSGLLVAGHYGRGLAILFFLWVLSIAFSILPTVTAFGSIFFLDAEGEIGDPVAYWTMIGISDVLSALVGLLVWPLMSLVSTHFYWDLRVRKEGLDFRTKLRQIDAMSS
jgi:hypothetical protein